MKRLLVVLLSAIMLFGCSRTPAAHQIRLDTLTLTLPSELTKLTAEETAAAFAYGKDGIYIHGFREAKADILQFYESVSLESYVRMLAESQEPYLDTHINNGIWSYSYTATPAQEEYTFLCAFYETPESFWRIQAGCPTTQYADLQQTLWHYVSAVEG